MALISAQGRRRNKAAITASNQENGMAFHRASALARRPALRALAFRHHPRYSSGGHAGDARWRCRGRQRRQAACDPRSTRTALITKVLRRGTGLDLSDNGYT
jgi:hypothetical protein